jgi:hypothetical protein
MLLSEVLRLGRKEGREPVNQVSRNLLQDFGVLPFGEPRAYFSMMIVPSQLSLPRTWSYL